MTAERVRVGVLIYLLLICVSSVLTCTYLLWQMVTQPETRGPEWVLLAFGVVWVTGVMAYVLRLLRPTAGRVA
ncbi:MULTISPECIES: hypothetical protein [unclassified Deinococcus]|uniref:hypothetical protein n=1 Tax=unclassified Deinococcus TaxID=2623546 RepID=UPI001E33CC36|nr:MULTISPECIES: hypothetical protein [unclassified Deinococcus]MCD0155874.1 hypothetical protein [Deinococcus sp. 6GRE01]MCD0160286.1 hypothetical protein [Deinococcus sp. 6YEL10]